MVGDFAFQCWYRTGVVVALSAVHFLQILTDFDMSQPAVAYGTWFWRHPCSTLIVTKRTFQWFSMNFREAGSSRVEPEFLVPSQWGYIPEISWILQYYGYDNIVVLPMCCLWRLLSRHMSLNPPWKLFSTKQLARAPHELPLLPCS